MRNSCALLMLLLPAVLHAQAPPLTLTSPNPGTGGGFGWSVSGVPDADGDGRGDLLVGAVFENGGAAGAGRAYLFSGASGVLLRTLTSPNPDEDGRFGQSVSGVPDADGDGLGDLLVGAIYEDGGAVKAGRAYLFSGASGVLLRTLTSPNPEEDGYFGAAVSGVPDADGDGRGDLLVGASYTFVGDGHGEARAYLFSGATGALLRTLVSPNPESSYPSFGDSVSGVPDADGDGRGDLLIGANGEDAPLSGSGRAYLFSGANGSLLRTLESPNAERAGYFGYSVSGVPDANGDGLGDLFVNARLEDVNYLNDGNAYLFSGATGAPLHTLENPGTPTFGYAGSGVADTDGDGRGDLLVGSYAHGDLVSSAGRAFLFSGATGTLLRTLSSPNEEINGEFGYSVSGVADTDGDGRGDLLVGAVGEAMFAGRAYLFPSGTGSSCDTPTSLSTSSVTDTSATLSWDVVSGAVEYQLNYKVVGATKWIVVRSTGNSKTLGGLTPETNYVWRVRTVCSKSPLVASAYSAQVQFTTTEAATTTCDFVTSLHTGESATPSEACAVPANVTEVEILPTRAILRWDAVSGALGYEIKYYQFYPEQGATLFVCTTRTRTTLENLNRNAAYRYQIRAICSEDPLIVSDYTPESEFRTTRQPR